MTSVTTDMSKRMRVGVGYGKNTAQRIGKWLEEVIKAMKVIK